MAERAPSASQGAWGRVLAANIARRSHGNVTDPPMTVKKSHSSWAALERRSPSSTAANATNEMAAQRARTLDSKGRGADMRVRPRRTREVPGGDCTFLRN